MKQNTQKTTLSNNKSEQKKTELQSSFFKTAKVTQLKSFDFLSTNDLANTAVVNKEFCKLAFDSVSNEAVLYKTLVRGQKILDTNLKIEKEATVWGFGPFGFFKDLLKTKNGLIALGEDLIQNLLEGFGQLTIQDLLTNNGLIALREGLIQGPLKRARHTEITALLTDNGMIALREGLIQDLLPLGNAFMLPELLTNNNGLIALREGLIQERLPDLWLPGTLQQALTDEALDAAREARNAAPGL